VLFPYARGVPIFLSNKDSFFIFAINKEQVLIASTVQPDKKLIVFTSKIPKMSIRGFIIIPPPIPQIAPIIEAKKLITKNKKKGILSPILHLMTLIV
jgi:hypothetical protein